jgi:predicted enzyme related to lactoylglutathione lyase
MKPVVHLELHTSDLAAARDFYRALCGWRPQTVTTAQGSYLALGLGGYALGGGIVECQTPRSLWLPYVEVPSVEATTDRARELGAAMALAPREGPHGWRSVIRTPCGGEVAFWEPKQR